MTEYYTGGLIPRTESFSWSTALAREEFPAEPADLPVSAAVDERVPPQGREVPDTESRYETLLAQDPDNPSALHQLSLLRLRRGAFADAVPLIERLIDRPPQFFA